jgi:hypothetical protein
MPTPEEQIAELAPYLLWRRPGIITDPIWMEYVVEQGDPTTRNQLAAVRLETAAAVHSAIAEGAAKAAKIVGNRKA